MAEETERIAILLQARDRDLQRALDRSNKLIARFERDAGRAATKSAQQIETGMSRMGSAIDRVGGNIQAFGAGILGGVFAGALAAVTTGLRQSVTAIAEIGDAARRSGLGVEQFQELAFVAQQSRIPVDALTDGMKELSLRADEFVTTGGGSAAEAFQRLGFTAAQLRERMQDPSELLLEIVGRMEDLDRAAQIRIADEVFGGTGGERFVELLSRGEDGLRQMMERGHEVGAVLDEEMIAKAAELDARFNEVTTRMSGWFRGLVIVAGESAAGIGMAFTDLVEFLGELTEESSNAEAILARYPHLAQLVGAEAAAAIEQIGDLSDEQAISVQALAAEYSILSGEAENLVGALRNAADEAEFFERDQAAAAMRQLADALARVIASYDSGGMSAEQFADSVDGITTSADLLVDSLSRIDGADFANVISRIGGVQGALSLVVTEASNAARALAAMMARVPQPRSQDRLAAQEGRLGAVSVVPTMQRPSVRPAVRPDDIDFGYIPPTGSGSGSAGGGGGGGPSPVEEFERLLEALDPLVRATNDFEEAQATINAALAAGAVGAEEAARAYELAEQRFREATDRVEESVGLWGDLERVGGNALDRLIESTADWRDVLIDAIKQFAIAQARSALLRSMPGANSSASLGTLLFQRLAGSWEGGGGTWQGPRSGGLDGRGGRLAMLHPDETVIDHRAARPSLVRGQAQQVQIVVRHEPGMLIETMQGQIAQAAPVIVRQSVAATGDMMRATKTFGNRR